MPLLHLSVTATAEDDVPLIFLKYMSLSFTRDGACSHFINPMSFITGTRYLYISGIYVQSPKQQTY